jgi:hypothetical protein
MEKSVINVLRSFLGQVHSEKERVIKRRGNLQLCDKKRKKFLEDAT